MFQFDPFWIPQPLFLTLLLSQRSLTGFHHVSPSSWSVLSQMSVERTKTKPEKKIPPRNESKRFAQHFSVQLFYFRSIFVLHRCWWCPVHFQHPITGYKTGPKLALPRLSLYNIVGPFYILLISFPRINGVSNVTQNGRVATLLLFLWWRSVHTYMNNATYKWHCWKSRVRIDSTGEQQHCPGRRLANWPRFDGDLWDRRVDDDDDE